MEEKSKLAYVVSLHFAVFATGASSNGGISASFILGVISVVILVLTTSYEVIFVSPRRKFEDTPSDEKSSTED